MFGKRRGDDIYRKGDTMEWDEAEYKYFMTLDDMTKVYYLHDFLYEDEFQDMQSDIESDEFEELPYESDEITEATKVNVIFDRELLIIECKDETLMDKTISMFMLDGFILKLKADKWPSRIYEIINIGQPVSMN